MCILSTDEDILYFIHTIYFLTTNMRLLVHNMLTSNIIKGVTEGFPLKIVAKELKTVEQDFNPEFIARMIPRIEWPVFVSAAETLGVGSDLPQAVPENASEDNDFLKKTHHALLEVQVKEGELICPVTGRSFPITNGIPNMLLTPEET